MADDDRPVRLGEDAGVPVVERERPGAIVDACVVFPVGQAHEPPALRGITHLVEHLAHDGLGEVDYTFNASVSVDRTEFWARGTAEEVRGHLEHVISRLVEPPIAAVAREAGVLRAERSGGGAPVFVERFTPEGFGGLDWREFFLDDPDPERLAAWAAERFVRRGAVAHVVGGPLELGLGRLPVGSAHPAPRADPRPGFSLPAHGEGPPGSVAWSGACGAGWAGSHAMAVLEARCRRRLRDELGATYGLGTSVERRGDVRYRWLYADYDETGDPRAVRDVLLEELDRLAGEPPGEDEVERPARLMRRNLEDPEADVALVAWLARIMQDHGRWQPVEELVAEMEAVRPAEVTSAAVELRGSMLLHVPPGSEPTTGDLPAYRAPAEVAPDAPEFVPSRVRRGVAEQNRQLRIEPGTGVVEVRSSGAVTAMTWDDVVLLVVEDDIATWLYDRRGREIAVELDDDGDREGWLGPALRAIGPERVARRETGRQALRAALEDRAAADLADAERHARGTLGLEGVVERHERVLRLAAARDDGDEVLLAVTDLRFVAARIDRVDGVWWPLSALAPRAAKDGLRGGRLEIDLEGGGTVSFDRIKPRGRAAEIAQLLRSDAAPPEAAGA